MIFDLVNSEPVITIEGLSVPEMLAIWKSDESPDKGKASRQLKYVYHMAEFSSVYGKLSVEDREQTCTEDFLEGGAPEEELIKLNLAIAKYGKLHNTPAKRLLAGAIYSVDKMTEYFYSIDFSERDDRGKPIHNAKDLASNLEKIGKIVISLSDLEEVVNKEKAAGKQISRGAKPSAIL
jgi:hypothetical protein